MTTFRVIRTFSHVYEVEADSMTDAENFIIDADIEPKEVIGTDDIYTEEI